LDKITGTAEAVAMGAAAGISIGGTTFFQIDRGTILFVVALLRY
jgi:hypothetical protein